MEHTAHLEKPKESAIRSAVVWVFITSIVIMMSSKFVLCQTRKTETTLQPVHKDHAHIKRKTQVRHEKETKVTLRKF